MTAIKQMIRDDDMCTVGADGESQRIEAPKSIELFSMEAEVSFDKMYSLRHPLNLLVRSSFTIIYIALCGFRNMDSKGHRYVNRT